MYELFDILEKHGFITLEHVDKIADLPEKKLEKLYSDVYSSVFSAQTARAFDGQPSHLPDTFSFHASASIRGASGCSAPECRINKLNFLGRYAALYATELTFPLSMVAPERAEGIADMRGLLGRDLPALLYLRPLITGGIVFPVMMRTQRLNATGLREGSRYWRQV
jgi:hypothetical protein